MYYNLEEKRTAIRLYKQIGNAKKVAEILGYPSGAMLYKWLEKEDEYLSAVSDNENSNLEDLYAALYIHSVENACIIEAARIALNKMTSAYEHHPYTMTKTRFTLLSIKQKKRIEEALRKTYPKMIIRCVLDLSVSNVTVPLPEQKTSLQEAYKQLKKSDLTMAVIIEAVRIVPLLITLGNYGESYAIPLNSVKGLHNRYKAEIVFSLENRFVETEIMQLIDLNPSSYGYYRRLRNSGRLRSLK